MNQTETKSPQKLTQKYKNSKSNPCCVVTKMRTLRFLITPEINFLT